MNQATLAVARSHAPSQDPHRLLCVTRAERAGFFTATPPSGRPSPTGEPSK